MTKFKMIVTGLMMAPALAFAAGAEMDVNGDGMLSVDEVQTAAPAVSTDMFMEMDVDGDGLLNADEVAAAEAAGTLPMPDAG